jgi:hypothetical protein
MNKCEFCDKPTDGGRFCPGHQEQYDEAATRLVAQIEDANKDHRKRLSIIRENFERAVDKAQREAEKVQREKAKANLRRWAGVRGGPDD